MLAVKIKPSLHYTINKLFAIFLLCFSLYSFYLMRVTPAEYIRFFAFVFAGVFCPGLFVAKLIKYDNSAELYSYSMAFGISINAFLYALCGLLGHLELYVFFALALSLVGIALFTLDIKKNGFKKELFILPPTVVTVMMVMMLVVIFTFCFRNICPDIIGENAIHPDVIWSLGNINSLTRSFPPRTTHANIGVLQYHYFAMLLRAMLSLATAISTEKIFFALGQFIIVPFLIVSVYALLKKMFTNQRFAHMALGIFLLSGCASSAFYIFGKGDYFLNHFFTGFWAYPNGSDVAISFFCLWMLSFIKIYHDKLMAIKIQNVLKFFIQFSILAGFCFLATMSKGPFGALCVAAAVGIPFCLILQKKSFLKTSFYSLASVSGFLVTIMFFVSTTGEPNTLFISSTVKKSLFWKNILAPVITACTGETQFLPIALGNNHFLDISALFIPLHAILFFLPTCIFMIFLTVKLVKKFKDISFERLLLLGTAYAGIVCGYFLMYGGSSQTYFLLAAHLPITILGLQWLFENYALLKKPIKALILLAFSISFITGISEYTTYISSGFTRFIAVATQQNMVMPDRYKSCTQEEYLSALWLKENTPCHSIVATNRHFMNPVSDDIYPPYAGNSRYFYLSAYSSRQIFLEAWTYVDKDAATQLQIRDRYEGNRLFYLNTEIDKPHAMKKLDVDYIYVSKFISPKLELHDAGLKKVFSNAAADIYAIEQ